MATAPTGLEWVLIGGMIIIIIVLATLYAKVGKIFDQLVNETDDDEKKKFEDMLEK